MTWEVSWAVRGAAVHAGPSTLRRDSDKPTAALFAGIKATIGLRVSEEEEMEGLDIREHGTHGYGLESANVG